MKNKTVWLILSCILLLALLLASCRPAVEEKAVPSKEKEKAVVLEEKKEAKELVAKKELVVHKVGEPKYGGVFTWSLGGRLLGFDEYTQWQTYTYTIHYTNEELIIGDWAKGPAGTNEAGWLIQGTQFLELSRGALAESWEIPDTETLIFHIRKGVRFHNKPPVNGREMTADDVVYSLTRMWGIGGEKPGIHASQTSAANRPVSITAPDKWTVVIKCPEGMYEAIFRTSSDYCSIVPQEMIKQYGSMEDWRHSCGTGPFMLVDHVDSASTTLAKNPNYWMKDPVHPENTLPYLDGIKLLIIPDASTQLAAMRTGKVDWLRERTLDDLQSLLATNPDLQYQKYLFHLSYQIYMRVDKPESPFHDIRVRRALAMAIDREAIRDEFYRGNAELLTHPILPVPEFIDMYWPLKELPESTRELYEYHPDKAKQLLAEAGYPNGFKTKIYCIDASVDMLSIIKAYWADVGVDLDMQVNEYVTHLALLTKRQHEELAMNWAGNAAPLSCHQCRTYEHFLNWSGVDDKRCQEVATKIGEVYFDDVKRHQLLRDFVPYYLDQCWSIETPTPYLYCVWQPWVGGYHGEYSVGLLNTYNFINYIWVDQDIKEAYTGRR